MASKNPLLSPAAGSSKGRDMVASPGDASGKGSDFVQDPKGSQGWPKGKDFVAVDRDQPKGSPTSRGGPAAGACPASVPEGGPDAPIALDNKLAPGNGGSQALRPDAGGSQNKPFRIKQ